MSKKLKIVMDFRKYDGAMAGVEIVVYELCKYLGDHGHKILLACKHNRLDEMKKIFSELKNVKFVSVPVKSHQMSLKNLYIDNYYLQNLAVKEGADLVHFPYNWSFPFRKKVPTLLTIHDLVPFTIRDGMPWFKNKFWYKPGMKLSAKLNKVIATVSNFSKQDIVKKLKVKEEKVKVILNGFQEFKKTFDKKEFEQAKKLIGNDYIFNVGGLKERKNVVRLIEAFSRLVKEGYKGKLVITNHLSGSVYYEKRHEIYMDVAKELGVEEKIIFTDFIDEGVLGKVMREANFTVYASLFEGFGLPILESMNLGIPCITSNVTSMPEVAEDGALLVDPYSVDDIYKKMMILWKDEKVRNKLIKRGKEIVKKYSWKKTGRGYLKVYRDLLESWGK